MTKSVSGYYKEKKIKKCGIVHYAISVGRVEP